MENYKEEFRLNELVRIVNPNNELFNPDIKVGMIGTLVKLPDPDYYPTNHYMVRFPELEYDRHFTIEYLEHYGGDYSITVPTTEESKLISWLGCGRKFPEPSN